MKKVKEEKGITMVSLIITIILLLLLSVVTIQLLTNTGVFESANKAKLNTKRAQIEEWLRLKVMEEQTSNPTGTPDEVIQAVRKNVDNNKSELEEIDKPVTVGEISTEEDNVTVDMYFYVKVNKDMYKVDYKEQKFIGQEGKLIPTIKIDNISSTGNAITVKVLTHRNEGGKIEYYIKGENDKNYTLKATKDSTGTENTYDGLEENKKYSIKVVAVSKEGEKAEDIVEATAEKVRDLTLADIEFICDPTDWTNKSIKVTAKTKIDIGNFKIITSKDGQNWDTTATQTFTENGTMYVVLTDGTNKGQAAAKQIEKIDKISPSAVIELDKTSTVQGNSITATIKQTDEQSGINVSKCGWVYNTNSKNIGTNLDSYTGKFTNETEDLKINATKQGTYYLHVLTVDNAGNAIETISDAITVSNPEPIIDKLSVGDYVAYDATNNYSYKSPIGTGKSHGNGSSEQTFTSSSSLRWRVWSIDKETGEIVLVSAGPIKTDANSYFGMAGAIGYLYAEEELNRICSIYGHGIGANTSKTFNYQTGDIEEELTTGTLTGSGARSIKAEDINKKAGYTPGEPASAVTDRYYPTIKTESGHSETKINRLYKNTYYYYDFSPADDTTISVNDNYWLASRCIIISNDTNHFHVRRVEWNSVINASRIFYGSYIDYRDEGAASAIRPLVYLKPGIKTSGKDENGAWKIQE